MTPLAKYGAFAAIAATQAARVRGELYARMAFVVVILGVFSALWRAASEAGLPVGVDRAGLVWYLAATEWIILSAPPIHVEIESEIRRGDIAYQLARPFSYLASLAAQGLGLLAVRAPLIGLAAWACAYAFTGTLPPASVLGYVIPFGIAAMGLVYALYVLVGLTAFWLGDVSPIFWITQKLLFVLGGLMLPLSIYPEWMQRAAYGTPFPVMLAGPAGFLIGASEAEAWRLAFDLVLWSGIIGAAAHLMFRRAIRRLQVNGG
jgi:ABC-2 type transport system permease protein